MSRPTRPLEDACRIVRRWLYAWLGLCVLGVAIEVLIMAISGLWG